MIDYFIYSVLTDYLNKKMKNYNFSTMFLSEYETEIIQAHEYSEKIINYIESVINGTNK